MERFIEVPGGRLFVADDGDGPPLVLLHAGICDSRSWDPIVPGLVDAGYRVVRYDFRGFGRSETEDLEFSNRADLVAVMDGLGISRAVLVGNSRGGHIAFDAAIEHPERVVAVVGVGAGLGGFEARPTVAERAMLDRLDALGEADEPEVAAIVDLDIQLWLAGPGQPLSRIRPDIVALVREMDTLANDPGREAGRPIPLDPVANEQLDRLRCPVLAIVGALDVSTSARTAEHLVERVPGARSVVLPDAAHVISLETPALLVETILDFLLPLGSWS